MNVQTRNGSRGLRRPPNERRSTAVKIAIVVFTLLATAVTPLATPAAMAVTNLDQENTGSPSGSMGADTLAQTFTAGVSGALTQVEVHISSFGNSVVQIASVVGGRPSGNVLASGTIISECFGCGNDWTTVSFAAPPTVTAGDQYAIVIRRDRAANSYIDWSVTQNQYGGGVGWLAGFPAGPFLFKTYVDDAPVDATPPGIAPTVTGTEGQAGWYTSDVTVGWTVTDDQSAISNRDGCGTSEVTADTGPAGTTLTCTAGSAGGQASESVTIQRDATRPTVTFSTCPSSPLLMGTSATASWTAADSSPGSGLATASTGAVTLDTSTPGNTSATAPSARDNAGNESAAVACSYAVVYDFSGFLQPVDNLPTINSVKAGSSVPVKFRLGGYQGLGIFAGGSPTSAQVPCPGGAPIDEMETVTTGNSGLSYDATTDQYSYTWKTERNWSGQCRKLTVKLADNTLQTALFKFK